MRIQRTAATALAVLCLSFAACDSGNRPVATSSTSGKPAPSSGKTGFAIGDLAPEISGTDLNGEPFKLSDYRGQVVVLDFWGNW